MVHKAENVLFFLFLAGVGWSAQYSTSTINRIVQLAFLSCTTLVLGVIWKVILYPKAFSPLKHFPEPKGGAFFNGFLWRILEEPTGYPMRDWINSQPNDGILRFTTVCNQERLLITSPEALKEVMVSKNYDWDKPKQMRLGLGRLLGHGVLLASGEEHRRQRKNLMPAFAPRVIDDSYQIFWQKSCELLDAMDHSITSDPNTTVLENGEKCALVNISDWLRRITLDIIGTAGMGYDFNALWEPENELNTAYDLVFNKSHNEQVMLFIETMENLVPVAWLGRLPLKQNTEVFNGANRIKKVAAELIRSKRMLSAEEKAAAHKGILTVALESGQFTDSNLVDQVMTFLAAGHETVSTSMTWALVMLCQYPDIQSRLRKEIQSELPRPNKHSPSPAPRTFDKLPYLRAVCNEVLRYHTPVPLSRRECVKDTSILGHYIPKGTSILLVPAAVNFSKPLWGDDALEFNPDRWMAPNCGSNGGATSSYANISFMHGPRSCIGMSFAKAEFACLLATVVGRFKIEFVEPSPNLDILRGGVTKRLKKDLKLRMTRLNEW